MLERQNKEPGARCSICKKHWYDVRHMVTAGKPTISVCDQCLTEMYSLLPPPRTTPTA